MRAPFVIPVEERDKHTSQKHCDLPQLSAELSRLCACVSDLSEVRRPGSWWVCGGEYTYCWSGRPQRHLEGVAVVVADRAYHETECLPYTGSYFFTPLGAPIGVRRFSVKEKFFAQLQLVVDSCPKIR